MFGGVGVGLRRIDERGFKSRGGGAWTMRSQMGQTRKRVRQKIAFKEHRTDINATNFV